MTDTQDRERFHGLPENEVVDLVSVLRQMEALPPEDRQEVLEFVAFVLRRRRQRAEASEAEPEDDCRLR